MIPLSQYPIHTRTRTNGSSAAHCEYLPVLLYLLLTMYVRTCREDIERYNSSDCLYVCVCSVLGATHYAVYLAWLLLFPSIDARAS
jgi:hypothetical protein